MQLSKRMKIALIVFLGIIGFFLINYIISITASSTISNLIGYFIGAGATGVIAYYIWLRKMKANPKETGMTECIKFAKDWLKDKDSLGAEIGTVKMDNFHGKRCVHQPNTEINVSHKPLYALSFERTGKKEGLTTFIVIERIATNNFDVVDVMETSSYENEANPLKAVQNHFESHYQLFPQKMTKKMLKSKQRLQLNYNQDQDDSGGDEDDL